MKTILIILSFIFSINAFAQNITNTLGTNGVFTIKDASANFLTLNQSTGQMNLLKSLRLENTKNSTTGIIFKGAIRFIHDFFPDTSYNTFIGGNSGNFTLTNANFNTATGFNTLTNLTTGVSNTATGYHSLYHNSSGSQNTSIGNAALHFNTFGLGNSALGFQALINNTIGNYNTILGFEAGTLITAGNNVTCLGNNAEPTTGTVSNQITLGNNAVTTLRCNTTTITSLSDARDKKNITDLNVGLDFLMKIKPRLFNWDKREWYDNNVSDESKMSEAPTAGFIAQELDEVQTNENAEWLNLVLKDNPEKLEATAGNLLPVMVKAIQELKIENDKLEMKNACLTARQESLMSEVESLKSMNEKIVKLEKIINELTSVKHTSFTEEELNILTSK